MERMSKVKKNTLIIPPFYTRGNLVDDASPIIPAVANLIITTVDIPM